MDFDFKNNEDLKAKVAELEAKFEALSKDTLSSEAGMERYESQHKKGLTRLTHLFGIPMVALSVLNIFNPPVFLTLFLLGWGLQILGHKVFEGNDPVIFQDPKKAPETMFISLQFAVKEWKEVFKGTWSLKDKD